MTRLDIPEYVYIEDIKYYTYGDVIMPPMTSHLATYIEGICQEYVHFTTRENAYKIRETGKLVAGDNDFNSIGEGIYCYRTGQGRIFGNTDDLIAIVFKTDLPCVKIVDYQDGIKPIGEHILMVAELNLTDERYMEVEDYLIYDTQQCTRELLEEIYCLHPDTVDSYLKLHNLDESDLLTHIIPLISLTRMI